MQLSTQSSPVYVQSHFLDDFKSFSATSLCTRKLLASLGSHTDYFNIVLLKLDEQALNEENM